MTEFLIFFCLFSLVIVIIVLNFLLQNNQKIVDIHTQMLQMLQKSLKLTRIVNENQDKEILGLYEKVESLEKDYITKKDLAEALKKVEEKFAFEINEIFQKVEKIDKFQSGQHKRLQNLENPNPKSWNIEDDDKIFEK